MTRKSFYKVNELAEHWGVLPKTIRLMIKRQHLKAYKIGSVIRISPETVQNYEERAVLLRTH